jgi:hypothetical protein
MKARSETLAFEKPAGLPLKDPPVTLTYSIDKVWIYEADTATWRHLSKTDPQFDWVYPHGPPGKVRFKKRLNSKSWNYVAFGVTPQEAADVENRHALKEIQRLELHIVTLRSTLVIPPAEKSQP